MASLTSTLSLPRDFLVRLRESSRLPSEYWTQFLGKDEGPAQAPVVTIAETALTRLAEELSLDANEVAEGHVDFGALAAHQEGNLGRLPERYESGFSKIRTSAHLFDRIESLFGWRARSSLLRRRQVTEAVIRDLDRSISVRFVTDLLEDVRKLGVSDAGFFKLGEQSLVRNYRSELGEQLRAAENLEQMYERCFLELIQVYYDRNFNYRLIQLTSSYAVVEASAKPEVCDAISDARPGSKLTCLNRAGGFASLSGYRRLPFASVREVACIHRGDSICRFEIDYAVPKRHERQVGHA